jgi:hypothetical protein
VSVTGDVGRASRWSSKVVMRGSPEVKGDGPPGPSPLVERCLSDE